MSIEIMRYSDWRCYIAGYISKYMFIILEKHHKKQQNISCICTKAFTFKLGTGIQSYKFAAKKFQQSQARQPIEL